MNDQLILDAHATTEAAPTEAPRRPRVDYRVIALVIAITVAVAAAVALILRDGSDDGAQLADVAGQGASGPPLAENGARLVRDRDGLAVEVAVATPEPGTYDYPTSDMVPPWADPHPRVASGASDAPEVFTLWLFAFNHPERCTDRFCDIDDVGADTSAAGGAYEIDGLVAEDDMMRFQGRVRLGQTPMNGAPLVNPEGAEVHVAIAPHGRALSGDDLHRQLNGPIGNPLVWWPAPFATPENGEDGSSERS